MISIVLIAAAQANGLPQYVPPIVPAGAASITSSLALMALIGTPAPIDFAVAMMSGAAPASFQYSDVKYFPVRQLPHCTSSAISIIPLSSQILRSFFTNSIGAGINPPSPCNGSIMIAATSLAGAASSKSFNNLSM